jgi:hypothetical protein
MSGAARHLTVLMDTKAIWLSLPPKLAFVTEVQTTPTDILVRPTVAADLTSPT